jgi:hypothetical protein
MVNVTGQEMMTGGCGEKEDTGKAPRMASQFWRLITYPNYGDMAGLSRQNTYI